MTQIASIHRAESSMSETADVEVFIAARAQRPSWPGIAEHLKPATIADAYTLQGAIHAGLRARGVTRVGYKVGSTSAAGQRAFGLQEPVAAGVFSDGRRATLADALSRQMHKPALECEIVFVLSREIDGADPTLSTTTIADAVAACHIGCEIIDRRYPDPAAVGIPALIADDFFHESFVVGSENQLWSGQDLAHVDASIEIDGNVTSGSAANVLSAFESVRWLAGKLAQLGTNLHAGDIVFTGAIVGPVDITLPARSVTLSIDGFQPLMLRS
jgi:2-keto-4-pentenoate hydratase